MVLLSRRLERAMILPESWEARMLSILLYLTTKAQELFTSLFTIRRVGFYIKHADNPEFPHCPQTSSTPNRYASPTNLHTIERGLQPMSY
jgi:hypothetical protein